VYYMIKGVIDGLLENHRKEQNGLRDPGGGLFSLCM
jgi:hypothetical protein